MRTFTKRNLLLFVRDRSAVFFSLLAVLIIIVLYIVFLGDVWLDDSMKEISGADTLMNSWLVAGLLAVASFTTTMGAFGVMLDDKVGKIDKDFYSSPIKKSSITGGYICSSCIIGIVMSFITTILAQIYLVLTGGEWFSFSIVIKLFLLTLLTAMANTSLVCFIVSLFKSHSAFSAANTIIGTLIGFLTGIYLPIGTLPKPVQFAIKVFPVSHSASLFRKILMEEGMNRVFRGIPSEYLIDFKEYMGVTYTFGNYETSSLLSILILFATTIVFFLLSLLVISKNSSNK